MKFLLREVRVERGTMINATVEDARAAGATEADIATAASGQIINEAHAEVLAIGGRVYTDDAVLAVIYRAKFSEAQAYIAAGKPANVSATDYPFLIAEAAARGVTKGALADLIIDRANAWQTFGGAMEATRVKIAADVKAAATVEAKQAAAKAAVDTLRAALPT